MNSLKRCGSLCCLLLLTVLSQGCDDIEERTAEPRPQPVLMPGVLDKPKFVENFTVGNSRRVAGTDIVETTVACNPIKRIPLTVRLVGFKTINKKPRWVFRTDNNGNTRWEGTVRFFLLSHGERVDYFDVKTDKPIQVASMVAPGYEVSTYMDSEHVPTALQGKIDQYGWAYETKPPATSLSSMSGSPLPR